MEYRGIGLRRAATEMIMERLESQEPETGGIIGLDADGNVVAVFNTSGMYHGWIDQDGRVETGIFR